MHAHHLSASCHIIHNPILISTLLHDSSNCVNQTLGKTSNTISPLSTPFVFQPLLVFPLPLSLFLSQSNDLIANMTIGWLWTKVSCTLPAIVRFFFPSRLYCVRNPHHPRMLIASELLVARCGRSRSEMSMSLGRHAASMRRNSGSCAASLSSKVLVLNGIYPIDCQVSFSVFGLEEGSALGCEAASTWDTEPSELLLLNAASSFLSASIS